MKRIVVVFYFVCVGVLSQAQTSDQNKRINKVYDQIKEVYLKGAEFSIYEKKDRKDDVPFDLSIVDGIVAKFDQNGVYLAGLPQVDVDPEVLKNKILPSPSKEEGQKYVAHVDYLNEVYKLAIAYNVEKSDAKKQQLQQLIFNSLEWYFNGYAPERPYWRVTMRFGSFGNGHNKSPLMASLDRIVILMVDAAKAEAAENNTKPLDLCKEIVNYNDHLIELAVGAQNRGVNWRARFNHIMAHYFVKDELGMRKALDELKYHFYDGFEYDPDGVISEGMGTLSDGGFWHHGRQPYCMPYGIGDYNGSVSLLKLLEDTEVEFQPRHYQTYETQMLRKWQYILYNDQWFDLAIVGGKNACQIKSYKARVNPGTFLGMIDLMLELDQSKFKYWDELKALRKDVANGTHDKKVSGNMNYWNWEYMVHRRPGWYIGFKGLSNKTITSEWDQNFHLSSGHTAILQRGGEYWKVRPALRWTALPGITAEQLSYKSLLQKNSAGTSAFCNGASDADYGVFGFDLGHSNSNVGTVIAKKSAFFFDEAVVGLTNDIERISTGEGKEVWTSLDNRELKGDIHAMINGKNELFNVKQLPVNHEFKLTKTSWFWHDGIAYVIPVQKGEAVDVKLIAEERAGSVKELLPHNNGGKFKHKTFLLAINHGVNPSDDKAVYMAYPGVTLNEMKKKSLVDYQVVRNDDVAQVVYDSKNQVAEFVIRKDTKVDVEGFASFEFSGPIIATARIAGDELIVSVANPYKSKLSADVSKEGNAAMNFKIGMKVKGDGAKNIPAEGATLLSFPAAKQKGYEGDSIVRKFKRD
ncbi:hypothetical protein EYV94_05530 [Puteibacter caeruleilacunae]|nr:hypothetical protein EYV94_05530 [Puteibacter caeruleilacunae]